LEVVTCHLSGEYKKLGPLIATSSITGSWWIVSSAH
jgi:hypothetical protein